MKKQYISLILVFLIAISSACASFEKSEIDSSGIFQNSYVKNDIEYVKISSEDEEREYITRTKDKEYAALPDFIQKGVKISFSYHYDKEVGGYVLTRISTPDSE